MRKKQTFGEWLNDWLNVYKKPFVKSVRNQKIIIRLHIPASIKNCKLDALDVVAIQRSINAVKQSRTRLDVFNVYHGALKTAFKLRLVPFDIADLLVKPKHVREVGTALTSDELSEFLKAIAGERLEAFYKFCLFTGCRRSEALGITWNDIDFEQNLLHVRGTKTATSDRVVPLFPDCRELLTRLPRKDGKVFHHRAEFVSKKFKTYCPAHKLHDLRHTFATRCLECGINIKVVQKWLGHSRLDTTASIYTHVQDEFALSESQKFRLL